MRRLACLVRALNAALRRLFVRAASWRIVREPFSLVVVYLCVSTGFPPRTDCRSMLGPVLAKHEAVCCPPGRGARLRSQVMSMRGAASVLLLLATFPLGCETSSKSDAVTSEDVSALSDDPDGDGLTGDDDCDETDPAVYVGAAEVCDGVDNDCDGVVDEDLLETFFGDRDEDGFGDAEDPVEGCAPGPFESTNANDCDDSNDGVYPGAIETCDGVDEDCDGEIDEGIGGVYYEDRDGDGYGDAATELVTCDAPVGWVQVGGDCDDDDARVFPDAPELCDEVDNNCDGVVDEGVTSTFFRDEDGDGYGQLGEVSDGCYPGVGYALLGGDCDDADPSTHPDAPELDCTDPHDYNCDGSVAYADADGDGWPACTECNDADASIRPDAQEVCNGIDDDCDGDVDDDDLSVDLSTASTWFEDGDSDGFGNAGVATLSCQAPSGYVADDTDCNDSAGAIHPAATEVCDSLDNDCDGAVDDADASLDLGSASTWYTDGDSDGFGSALSSMRSCIAPSGTVSNDADCDDSSAAIRPTAAEICDGTDNDCDGDVDDADIDVTGQPSWYVDFDYDGYGGILSAVACSQPSGTVGNTADCDDANGAVNPGATEVCNGIDDDCDFLADDSDPSVTGLSTWYVDGDGDGYGSSTPRSACVQPSGTSTNTSDCNDASYSVNPGATETCNHVDDDCDGAVDEGHDADGDGILDCDEITYTISWSGTGDDAWTAYVDGTSLGSYYGWNTVNTFTLTLDSGPHVLAAYAWDTGAAIAGFLSTVSVNGSVVSRTGDGSWRYTRSPGSSWTAVSYSSAGWSTPPQCSSSQVSSYWSGTPASLRGAGANWIWHSSNCTALGDAYFRYEFTLP